MQHETRGSATGASAAIARVIARGTCFGGLVAALAVPGLAAAATIQVTSLDDGVTDDGNCTLREAVRSANENIAYDVCVAGSPGADVVGLGAGFHTLTDTGAGQLEITEDLALTGTSRDLSVISASTLGDRLIHVAAGATVTIQDVTLRAGHATAGPGQDARGGGIL